jgi:hypothetical protein
VRQKFAHRSTAVSRWGAEMQEGSERQREARLLHTTPDVYPVKQKTRTLVGVVVRAGGNHNQGQNAKTQEAQK